MLEVREPEDERVQPKTYTPALRKLVIPQLSPAPSSVSVVVVRLAMRVSVASRVACPR